MNPASKVLHYCPPQFIFFPSLHILQNQVLWPDLPSFVKPCIFVFKFLSLSAPGVASSLPLPLSFCGFA